MLLTINAITIQRRKENDVENKVFNEGASEDQDKTDFYHVFKMLRK